MMPVPPKYDVPHLWIVISAPSADGSVVVVNATHDRLRAGREYILPAGVHRRLPDESYVNFSDAIPVLPQKIASLTGTLVTIEKPLQAALVAAIIAVAKTSNSIPVELKARL